MEVQILYSDFFSSIYLISLLALLIIILLSILITIFQNKIGRIYVEGDSIIIDGKSKFIINKSDINSYRIKILTQTVKIDHRLDVVYISILQQKTFLSVCDFLKQANSKGNISMGY